METTLEAAAKCLIAPLTMVLLAALMLVMTVLISWQVFARYVMGNSLSFSEEVSRFSMVWMTMLGAAYAYRYGSLISVDLFESLSGPRVSRLLRIVVAVASCIFAWVLLTQGLDGSVPERVGKPNQGGLRVAADELVEVLYSTLVLAKVGVLQAPVVVGAGILRVEANGLVVVLYGSLMLPKVEVGDALAA